MLPAIICDSCGRSIDATNVREHYYGEDRPLPDSCDQIRITISPGSIEMSVWCGACVEWVEDENGHEKVVLLDHDFVIELLSAMGEPDTGPRGADQTPGEQFDGGLREWDQ